MSDAPLADSIPGFGEMIEAIAASITGAEMAAMLLQDAVAKAKADPSKTAGMYIAELLTKAFDAHQEQIRALRFQRDLAAMNGRMSIADLKKAWEEHKAGKAVPHE